MVPPSYLADSAENDFEGVASSWVGMTPLRSES
jgi:hypothetical protein